MSKAPIILNVHFQAAPGHEEKLGAHLHALVAPTHEEPGCLIYELHFDPEDPSKFMFYEKFVDQAAIDHHINTAHFKQFQDYLKANEPLAAQSLTRWRNFV